VKVDHRELKLDGLSYCALKLVFLEILNKFRNMPLILIKLGKIFLVEIVTFFEVQR